MIGDSCTSLEKLGVITHFLVFLNSNWNSFNENWKKTVRKYWRLILLRSNLGLESTDNHSVWGIVCIFYTQSFILLCSYLQLRATTTCNNVCTMTLFICYINTLLILTLFLKLKHFQNCCHAISKENKSMKCSVFYSIQQMVPQEVSFTKWFLFQGL